jgi:hypothetical protein
MEMIVIVVLLGTVSSIARSVFGHRARRLAGVDGDALKRIEEGMAELRDQITAVRGDVTEMYERIDFTERMLAQQRDGMWGAGRLAKPPDPEQRDLSA